MGRKPYTKDFILKKLEEACKEKGRSVTSREINTMKGYPSRSQYNLKFGGINKALRLIGRVPINGANGERKIMYVQCDHCKGKGKIKI